MTFSIVFKKEAVDGNDLIFGNDFDRPIRDRLPPGINVALRMVKWSIDPGLEGDVYADKPYLFGPALGSWNYLRIGNRVQPGADNVSKVDSVVVEEGAEGDEGWHIRQERGIPGDAGARMKHFQDEEARKNFVFEKGREYLVNFGNPYICFNGEFLALNPFYNAYDDTQISHFSCLDSH